jgi:hypothetical protein
MIFKGGSRRGATYDDSIYGSGMTYPKARAKSTGFSEADYREAHIHCALASHGLPVDNMHPLAEATLDGGREFPISTLAASSLEVAGRPVSDDFDGYRTIIAALSTTDFPDAMLAVARGLAASRRSSTLQAILALTKRLEVLNYKDWSYSIVDLHDLPLPDANTTKKWHAVKTVATGQFIRTFTLHGLLIMSRQALVNDDKGFLRASVPATVDKCHRGEMRQGIVGTLEANADMQDGDPLFSDGTGNRVTAALDSNGLATAFATLRKQPTEGGDPTDAEPAVLLVHPDDELAALVLVESIPHERLPRVVASAHLSGDSYYLFADPAMYPVLGRVMMQGYDDTAVKFSGLQPAFEIMPDGSRRDYPGIAFEFSHSVGYAVLSRVGAVRVDKQ